MLVPRTRLTRFIILFTGRTGSSYLVSALDAHPDIAARGEQLEQFRKNGQAAAQLDWTQRFLTGRLLSPNRAVGFKTKFRDVVAPDDFADLLERLHVRIIHLSRRNDVKHAVSRINAHRLNAAIGAWNLTSPAQQLDAMTVDPHEFDVRLREVIAEKGNVSEYVSRLRLARLDVHYEELLARPNETFVKVLTFLGVRPAPMLGSTFKNTSDDLRDVVTNFSELRARYAGTRYEPMFDEVLPAAGAPSERRP